MEILDTGVLNTEVKPYLYKCDKCGHEQRSEYDFRKIHICEKCEKVNIPLKQIYLYEFKPNIIIRKLNSELLRRKLNDIVDIPCILMYVNGKEEYLHNLSTSYIENLIEELKKQK